MPTDKAMSENPPRTAPKRTHVEKQHIRPEIFAAPSDFDAPAVGLPVQPRVLALLELRTREVLGARLVLCLVLRFRLRTAETSCLGDD